MDDHKHFLPYEETKALKDLGFKDYCAKWVIIKDKGDYQYTAYYDYPIDEVGGISVPLWDQAFEFLRTEYNFDVSFTPHKNNLDNWEFNVCNLILSKEADHDYDSSYDNILFETRDEARLAALQYIINLIK